MVDVRREPHRDDVDVLTSRLSGSLTRSAPRSPIEALQPEQVPPPPPRSKVARHPMVIALNFLVTVAIVALVGAGGAIFFAKSQFEQATDLDAARTVTVARGNGLGDIANTLVKDGIIGSKWLFMAGVWLSNQTTNLKAGEYLVPAHASMRDIMDAMVTGKGILYSVTIPEGLTSQQIVDRLKSDDVLVGDIAALPPEGSLLPETYKFTRGDTRQDLIDRMQRDQERVIATAWSHRAPDLPLKTPEEMVVLASVVEKETALADERSRVAAVFINRLKLNMRLQSDPTVIYGMFGTAGKPAGFTLSRADLERSTPYNTYAIPALPPGPIANPGRASIEAVANPSRTRDLYFVADGSGGHAFAESYEDHLRNVSRWREIAADARKAEAAAQAAAAEAGAPAAADGTPSPAMALTPTPTPRP